ncbi:TIGR04282 family arsenosugar biosynthesis glycosyltransferase [Flagellimonas nanhaiensis]|uniref:TIGR04282 family arsenosugar biosynthesis glycosyltransferase n=1 Tax=Flagellimonas nanhaiensis TaxID=2292706 RepID=UPI0015F29F1A|nr:DUF2064 domain-containing protein [Allomuricauda nanhaiensis]
MQTSLVQNTAVLIFANSAEKDAHVKRIDGSSALFDRLTQQTLETVKASGLPYFLLTERNQYGATFSARFSNAIQEVFSSGYSQVISIGNDSPHLTVKHLLLAKQKLSKENIVLGPTLDGGFYLLGIHYNHFDKVSFEALPWQTVNLYQETLSYFRSNGCIVNTLDRLIDIDSIEDVKLLSNYIRTLSKSWISLFSGLWHKNIEILTRTLEVHIQILKQVPFNKGSPFAISNSI